MGYTGKMNLRFLFFFVSPVEFSAVVLIHLRLVNSQSWQELALGHLGLALWAK